MSRLREHPECTILDPHVFIKYLYGGRHVVRGTICSAHRRYSNTKSYPITVIYWSSVPEWCCIVRVIQVRGRESPYVHVLGQLPISGSEALIRSHCSIMVCERSIFPSAFLDNGLGRNNLTYRRYPPRSFCIELYRYRSDHSK